MDLHCVNCHSVNREAHSLAEHGDIEAIANHYNRRETAVRRFACQCVHCVKCISEYLNDMYFQSWESDEEVIEIEEDRDRNPTCRKCNKEVKYLADYYIDDDHYDAGGIVNGRVYGDGSWDLFLLAEAVHGHEFKDVKGILEEHVKITGAYFTIPTYWYKDWVWIVRRYKYVSNQQEALALLESHAEHNVGAATETGGATPVPSRTETGGATPVPSRTKPAETKPATTKPSNPKDEVTEDEMTDDDELFCL